MIRSFSSSLRHLVVPCFGAALVVLGACGREREETTGRRSQELVAESEHYIGVNSLGPKQLALTFDDGPGPHMAELSAYLKSEGIRAVFFVNGACIQSTALPNNSCGSPVGNAGTMMAQAVADGHLVGNHTTTHRDITTVPANQIVEELADTDALILQYAHTPYNRSLFRAPFGSWSAAVNTTLQQAPGTMTHYVGPIYWDVGGYSNQYPNAAADWACFQGQLSNASGGLVHSAPGDAIPDGYATTQECGDAYLTEINKVGRGIVLMHEPYAWSQGGSGGNTLDMVKYLVPILKANGYTFVRADEVPIIAGDFPACGANCATCSGPGANQCLSCAAGRFLSNGTCMPCTTCAAGTYPSAACTPTADTVCTACDPTCKTCTGPGADKCGNCKSGFYANGDGCTACTVCAAGSAAATACTMSADTVCAPCAAGTFASAGAACTPCAQGTWSAAGAASCTSCGSCDDGDACTVDGCSPTAGCTHTPVAGCGANEPPAESQSHGSEGPVVADAGTDASASSSSGEPETASKDKVQAGCQASGTSAGSWLFGSGLAALGVVFLGRRRRGRARA